MEHQIKIYLEGVPGVKGRPQFARTKTGVRTFTRAKTLRYEERLASVGKHAWPFAPMACPVKLRIVAVWPVTQSWPKWKRALAAVGNLWHVGRPDLDNVIKIACDGLNNVVWLDDGQVCWIEARKQYGPTPGLWLEIEPLDDTGLNAALDDAGESA